LKNDEDEFESNRDDEEEDEEDEDDESLDGLNIDKGINLLINKFYAIDEDIQ